MPFGQFTLCRACEDFLVCVAVMHLTLRTGCERHGRKNPLPFSYFGAVTCRQSAPDFLIRERQEFKEEGKPQVSLPFCPRRGRGSLTRSAERSSPLRFSENLPARTGRIANATRVPHKPVQKRRCPDRVNRLRGSGDPIARCSEKECRTRTPVRL